MTQQATPSSTNDFETWLSAYGQRSSTSRRSSKSTADIIGYTAAAGGLAFAGGDALGAVIHSTTPTSFQAYQSFANATWDVDGVGGGDLRFQLAATNFGSNYVRFSGSTSHSELVRYFTGTYMGFPVLGNSVAAMQPGAVLGPTMANGIFGSVAILADTNKQDFLATTAYFGFRFQGDTGTTGTQYGWAKARVDLLPGKNGDAIRLTIQEYAFDDSGAVIAVGDTGSGSGGGGAGSGGTVPAPGTAALALLGLGAMGVRGYRRRRDDGLKRLAEEQAVA